MHVLNVFSTSFYDVTTEFCQPFNKRMLCCVITSSHCAYPLRGMGCPPVLLTCLCRWHIDLRFPNTAYDSPRRV